MGILGPKRDKYTHFEDIVLKAVAYIDLNPVRSGLVEDPEDYRCCGYAKAVAGNAVARKGLMSRAGRRF